MATDPDGLWPRRADAASEGVDEEREIDDIDRTLEEDLLPEEEEEGEAEWMADADQRPVGLDDEEDRAEDRAVDEDRIEDRTFEAGEDELQR
ncbi:hypothetical protein E3T24_05450 [Cryobacterium sp. TmT2-59]|uniref:hypothetical protein n=1 Tax=unclassified Cryobacterium TaxID=2649013 RepID=UPI00106A731D|nr:MULTISPECIES: hypothetical protein [unclassified Cryobacterium]TFC87331.1 hypothetical protein E3T24_05450 [Cryobacterium sp. TmT2-59]TFD18315.1 hypothetical protein E3T42_06230 [Cryobacterium sp. TMT4-10]